MQTFQLITAVTSFNSKHKNM